MMQTVPPWFTRKCGSSFATAATGAAVKHVKGLEHLRLDEPTVRAQIARMGTYASRACGAP